MPRHTLKEVASPRFQDVPLPGTLRCLVLQLNATYYAQGTVRWVGSLRDPEGGVEFDRVMAATRDDDQESYDIMMADLSLLVASAEYQLRGTPVELQEALDAEVPPPPDPPKRTRTARPKG